MDTTQARKILGIAATAATEPLTEATIKKAYRLAARDAHPDTGGSHEAMQEVTEARDNLLAHLAASSRARTAREGVFAEYRADPEAFVRDYADRRRRSVSMTTKFDGSTLTLSKVGVKDLQISVPPDIADRIEAWGKARKTCPCGQTSSPANDLFLMQCPRCGGQVG